MKERLVAAMPLISLLLFLFSGLVLDNWSLGISFFLLIPISAILLSRQVFKRLNQMMPLIALIVFLWLWLGFDLAHPGWVVFFLIPLSNILYSHKVDMRSLVTLIVTIAYIVLGIVLDDFWHPGWIMLLLIPIINTIFFPKQHIHIRRSGEFFRSTFSDIVDEKDVTIEDDEK